MDSYESVLKSIFNNQYMLFDYNIDSKKIILNNTENDEQFTFSQMNLGSVAMETALCSIFRKYSQKDSITQFKFRLKQSTSKYILLCSVLNSPECSNIYSFTVSVISSFSENTKNHIFISRYNNNTNTYDLKWVLNNIKADIVFTKNEFEILSFIQKGYLAKEIAHILTLSEFTVNEYKERLLKIFEVNTIYELMNNAYKKEAL